MAIVAEVDIISTALWPQGDARDPLGVWGGRSIQTGDATAGSIKVGFQPGAERAGAHLYTCYSAIVAQLSAPAAANVKCRLLTSWPDIDTAPGVQGYGSVVVRGMSSSINFTAPTAGPSDALVSPAERFMLLFDPRPVAGAFTIVELEHSVNTDTLLYSFEAWGYYWDRAVMSTPGGPRHPGSS